MSRQLPPDPEDWTEEEALYAAARPGLLDQLGVEIDGLPEPAPFRELTWEEHVEQLRADARRRPRVEAVVAPARVGRGGRW